MRGAACSTNSPIAAGVLTRLPVGGSGGRAGRGRRRRLGVSRWSAPASARSVRWRISSPGCCGLPAGRPRCSRSRPGSRSTGALHEDGLADTADGFGGGRDRDHKLAIMRDSRHGTLRRRGARAQHRVARGRARRDRRPDLCRAGVDRRACRVARRFAAADASAAAGPRRRARRRGRTPEPAPSRSPRRLIGGVIALATARAADRRSRACCWPAARSRSPRCLRGGRSAATPATFSAFSSRSERS